jgi:flagellin
MVVRTNVLALNSHRNLGLVGNQQARASARLSSGFRINSAADDAAGLAISEGMRAQIRGLNQGSRNAQDGISLIQTAEGYMQTVTEMGQRIRELIVQASNDTYNADQRQTIHNEITQLTAEIQRIWETATFNGIGLFGEGPNVGFEVELTVAQLVASPHFRDTTLDGGDWADIEAGQLAALNDFFNGSIFQDAVFNDNALTATNIEALIEAFDDAAGTPPITIDDAAAFLADLNNFRGQIVAALPTEGRPVGAGDIATGGALAAIFTAANSPSAAHIGAMADFLNRADVIELLEGAVAAVPTVINAAALTGLDGWTTARTAMGIEDGENAGTWGHTNDGAGPTNDAVAALINTNAQAILDIVNGRAAGTVPGVEFTGGATPEAGILALSGNGMTEDPLFSRPTFSLQVGPDTTHVINVTRVQPIVTDVAASIYTGELRDITELATAGTATDHGDWNGVIPNIDSFLGEVNALRAALGAYQNRLEFTIENADIASENLSASESRIRDADMAAEMMRLTQANVLQQAATAMLAQANQAPQSILQLLG